MTKLTKAQEKRFKKWYEPFDELFEFGGTPADIKELLADELSRQKKEIKSKLEKMKAKHHKTCPLLTSLKPKDRTLYRERKYCRCGVYDHNETLDQAIKEL